MQLNDIGDIKKVIGSKYCHADLSRIFKNLEEDILKDKKVLFIGLPCQAAAVKMKFARFKKLDNLILVDLACHGIVPQEYLQQHVSYIANKYHKEVSKITFRDKNSSYYLSLYDNKFEKFYSKQPKQDDVYYRGFTNNLILRENCYNCHYARKERITDITIGDFDGLNDNRISEENKSQVSIILTNTKKGEEIINLLISNKKIVAYRQKSVEAAIEHNKALNSKVIKHENRKTFENEYILSNNFEKAATLALKNEIKKYRLLIVPKFIYRNVSKLFPKKFKQKVKNIIRKT